MAKSKEGLQLNKETVGKGMEYSGIAIAVLGLAAASPAVILFGGVDYAVGKKLQGEGILEF
jgi:hypothetical protein